MDIQLDRVSKSFETQSVLREVTLTFLEGRINCLMGPSGIGKTTLVHILLGLLKADSGEIHGCRGKRFAAVFQEDRLIEHWDAIKNIRLVCDKNISTDRIEQELYEAGLEETEGKPVKNFSGGMKRRVALVRAMLSKSDIILLDEPFKGLDDELKKQIMEYVIRKTKGKTVIVVTHDKEDAMLLGANILTLS